MKSVLFSIPIKAGTFKLNEKFVKTILGPKKNEYQDMLRRYGLKNAKVWRHTIGNTGYLLTMHEMLPQAQALLEGFATSTNPFDKWFHDECLKVWDAPSFSEIPIQPTLLYEIDA